MFNTKHNLCNSHKSITYIFHYLQISQKLSQHTNNTKQPLPTSNVTALSKQTNI